MLRIISARSEFSFLTEDLSYLPRNFRKIHDSLMERLLVNVPQYYPNLAGSGFSIREQKFKWTSYPIYCFRIVFPRLHVQKEVFVKFAPVTNDRNEALAEYRNLTALYQYLKDRDVFFGSPRPLDFFSDINALVMEGFEGVPFKKILLKNNQRFSRQERKEALCCIVQLCAMWLRTFHALEPEEIRNFDAGIFNKTGVQIDRLEKCGFSSSLLMRVRQCFDLLNQCGATAKIGLPATLQHGDLAMDNILVHGNRICVLDLSYESKEVIYKDLAYFMVSLETVRCFPGAPFYSHRGARNLQNVFLSAYFGEGHPQKLDNFFVHLFLLLEMLSRCDLHLRVATSYPPIVSILMRIRTRYLFSKLILRETTNILQKMPWPCRAAGDLMMVEPYEAKQGYKKSEADVYDAKRFSSLKGKVYHFLQMRNLKKGLQFFPVNIQILDIPCGTGRITEELVKYCSKVFAGDISEDMLSVAKRKLSCHKDAIQFEKVDAEKLSYPDARFDGIVCIKLMHLLPVSIQNHVLQELARVSRKWLIVSYAYRSRLSFLKKYILMKKYYRVNPSSEFSRMLSGLQEEFKQNHLKVIARYFTFRMFSDEVLFVLEKDKGDGGPIK